MVVIIWLCSILVGYLLGDKKGQVTSGILWTLFLGPLGVIIVLCLPDMVAEAKAKKQEAVAASQRKLLEQQLKLQQEQLAQMRKLAKADGQPIGEVPTTPEEDVPEEDVPEAEEVEMPVPVYVPRPMKASPKPAESKNVTPLGIVLIVLFGIGACVFYFNLREKLDESDKVQQKSVELSEEVSASLAEDTTPVERPAEESTPQPEPEAARPTKLITAYISLTGPSTLMFMPGSMDSLNGAKTLGSITNGGTASLEVTMLDRRQAGTPESYYQQVNPKSTPVPEKPFVVHGTRTGNKFGYKYDDHIEAYFVIRVSHAEDLVLSCALTDANKVETLQLLRTTLDALELPDAPPEASVVEEQPATITSEPLLNQPDPPPRVRTADPDEDGN